MELLGEYIGLEGQRQQLRVPCEAPGVTDPFQSLLSGVAQMRELVTELFGSQVMMKMIQKMKITLITELIQMDHLQNGKNHLN
ncbi:EKC/KEOPS complex subunit GON7 isoform X2 [Oryx dammah]|uniref:EKC/KEOPS complex subunit GON7 isoform X2 n=1 Tax=Oryx dammah TaxID=59534 RepID=UPI001A9ABE3C|nr:EKC/KEOPS complex subunit GON7 isoform X2 [Oryx dammah]